MGGWKMKKTKKLLIWISPDEFEKLKKESIAAKESMAEIVRIRLDKNLTLSNKKIILIKIKRLLEELG